MMSSHAAITEDVMIDCSIKRGRDRPIDDMDSPNFGSRDYKGDFFFGSVN